MHAAILDIEGRLVQRRYDGVLAVGLHRLSGDRNHGRGRAVPEGICLARFSMSKKVRIQRIVILR